MNDGVGTYKYLPYTRTTKSNGDGTYSITLEGPGAAAMIADAEARGEPIVRSTTPEASDRNRIPPEGQTGAVSGTTSE